MLEEARKRDLAANAVLGLAFATSAAQSPKDFVRTGYVESPGVAMMQRTIGNSRRKPKDLDKPAVKSRGTKTFEEFIAEAKKCWPGYKKKGTQKLFGKTYNRCVKAN